MTSSHGTRNWNDFAAAASELLDALPTVWQGSDEGVRLRSLLETVDASRTEPADDPLGVLLHRLAEVRREYTDTGPDDTRALIAHEAEVLEAVASAVEDPSRWRDIVACYAPSWRWAELEPLWRVLVDGQPAPTPDEQQAIYDDVRTELGIAFGWSDSDPDDVRDWRHDLVTRVIALTQPRPAPTPDPSEMRSRLIEINRAVDFQMAVVGDIADSLPDHPDLRKALRQVQSEVSQAIELYPDELPELAAREAERAAAEGAGTYEDQRAAMAGAMSGPAPTPDPWAVTRLEALRKLRREGYSVVQSDALAERLYPTTGRTAEAVAQAFHETYERLAPSFGYETREASAVPWADVPDENKRLMVAVADELLSLFGSACATPAIRETQPEPPGVVLDDRPCTCDRAPGGELTYINPRCPTHGDAGAPEPPEAE